MTTKANENKPGLIAGKSSDNYNGYSTDRYSWSQTIQDVDIKIPVPTDVRKGKDVLVDIKVDSLDVRLLAQPSGGEGQTGQLPLLSGELPFAVNKEESYWSLIPGDAIHISLQKSKERWWTSALKNEEGIDVSSIEATIPMEDLQDAEQMKVQELIWKEEQKQKGLPANDMNIEKIMKKAWNAEGSPFKGMPYDPTLVNFGSDQIPPEVLEAAKNAQ